MWFQKFTKGYLILNYILLRVVLAPWTLANGFLFIRLPKAWNLRWNLVLPSSLPHIYLLNPAITIAQIYPFFFICPDTTESQKSKYFLDSTKNFRISDLSLGAAYCPGSMSPQGIISRLPQGSPDYCAGPYRDNLPAFILRCAILLRPFGLARTGRGGNVIM